MLRNLLVALTVVLVAWPMPSFGQSVCGPRVKVDYYEDAPSDYFVIQNLSPDGWSIQQLIVDLKSSRGNLIFDTAAGGAGASSYEPFRSAAGRVQLSGVRGGEDGAQFITLDFSGFLAGEKSSFLIDLDDRLPESLNGPSHVAGSEILGAEAQALLKGPTGQMVSLTAKFDNIATADTGIGGCV